MKEILNEWKKFTKKINEQAPAMGLGNDGMDQIEAELEAELDVAAAQPGIDDALADIQTASAAFMGTGSPAPAATAPPAEPPATAMTPAEPVQIPTVPGAAPTVASAAGTLKDELGDLDLTAGEDAKILDQTFDALARGAAPS
tara:strand:- start:4813 stop:5241 length:429 start_codon:yes stop_codon:yes gene_type:complete